MLLRVLSDAVQPQLSKAIGGSRVGPFLLVAVCQKAATLVQLVLAARAKLLAGESTGANSSQTSLGRVKYMQLAVLKVETRAR